MPLEPLKYLIQPVAIERDTDTGRIVREVPAETMTVYSVEEAAALIVKFESDIGEFNSREGGGENAGDGNNGVAHSVRQPDLSREQPRSERPDRLDVRD